MKRQRAMLTIGALLVCSGCGLLNKVETQCHDGKLCPLGQACDVEAATCMSQDLAFAVPEGMAWIEGGTFLMGNESADDPDARGDEAPKHRETLTSFFLDQTEVTVGAYALFMASCGAACMGDMGSGLQADTGGACNWNVAGRDRHPINCIPQPAAKAYCRSRPRLD